MNLLYLPIDFSGCCCWELAAIAAALSASVVNIKTVYLLRHVG